MAIPVLGQTDFSPLFRAQSIALQGQQYASEGFLNLGKQISASIQINNAQKEAEAAAPFLASAYQGSLNSILNNDIPAGLSSIYAINARFANNPILAPSLEAMNRTAGALSNSVLNNAFRERMASGAGTSGDTGGLTFAQAMAIERENARREVYNANRPSDQPKLPILSGSGVAEGGVAEGGVSEGGVSEGGVAPGIQGKMTQQIPSQQIPSQQEAPNEYDPRTGEFIGPTLPQQEPKIDKDVEADIKQALANWDQYTPEQQQAISQYAKDNGITIPQQAKIGSPEFNKLSANQKVQSIRSQQPFTPIQKSVRKNNLGKNDFVINDAGPGYAAIGGALIVDVPEEQAMERTGMTVDPVSGKISVSYKTKEDESFNDPRIKSFHEGMTKYSQSPQLVNAVTRMGGLANTDVEFVASGKDENDNPQYRISLKESGVDASKSKPVTIRDAFGIEQPLTVNEDVKNGYMQTKSVVSEFETGVPVKGGGKLRLAKVNEKVPYDNTQGRLPFDFVGNQDEVMSNFIGVFQKTGMPEGTEEAFRRMYWQAFDEGVKEMGVDSTGLSNTDIVRELRKKVDNDILPKIADRYATQQGVDLRGKEELPVEDANLVESDILSTDVEAANVSRLVESDILSTDVKAAIQKSADRKQFDIEKATAKAKTRASKEQERQNKYNNVLNQINELKRNRNVLDQATFDKAIAQLREEAKKYTPPRRRSSPAIGMASFIP